MLVSDINNNKENRIKYRSKQDITAQILTAAKDKPLGKTKLMYSSMVSSSQLKEYLSEILDQKLLLYNEGSRMYQTTEEGLEFLRLYEKIKSLGDIH
jgi:predicted transcriptional regulator